MSTQNQQKAKQVLQLATRIEADIREKDLKIGDRYMSTTDVARMLRVDTTDVNKAMQLLVKRHILSRRQRLGTFVDKGLNREHVAGLKSVRFLVSDGEIRGEGLFDSALMMGLQEALPHVKLGIHFVSRANEVDELNRLIGEILRNPEPEGLILTGSTLYMQRAVAASGLPAVVLGHLYPSVKGMSFVDRDPVQLGQMLTTYLLDQGHERIVFMFRQHMLPGDHLMLDAAMQVIGERGLTNSAVIMRCLPFDQEVVSGEVESVLKSSDASTGFLVRVAKKADIVYDKIIALSKGRKRNASVVAADEYFDSAIRECPYPFVRATLSLREQGMILAQMLVQRAEDGSAHCYSDLLDVEMVLPPEQRRGIDV